MKVFWISAALAALTGTALADDPPAGDPPAGDPPAGGDPAVVLAPALPGSWTVEIISRPLTLKKGMIRIQGDLGISRTLFVPEPPETETVSSTGVSLAVGGGYGVDDKIEVGGSYGLSLKEFEAKGPLTIYAMYQLADGKLKLAPGAAVTYNLASEKAGLGAGLAAQYNITPKLAVFTPAAQLAVGFDPTTAAIDLPVGVMLQATANLNVQVRTSVASIGLEPSGSAFIFADRTPLIASVFYSPSNGMDLGVTIDAGNLPDIADVFSILVTARLFVM